MSLATWHAVPLDAITADGGWRFDDPILLEKLKTSLRRHGQVRPVVVRRAAVAGYYAVVDGRKLLAAMRALEWTDAMVADVGTVDAEAAARMALDLDLFFPTDYAKLITAVGAMLDTGATPESLASASPFTAERLAYMRTLAAVDWSLYRDVPAGQSALDWSGATELPLPVVAPAAESEEAPDVEAFEPLPDDEVDEAPIWIEKLAEVAPAPAAAPAPEPERATYSPRDGMLF